MIKIKFTLLLLLITQSYSSFTLCMDDDFSYGFDDIFDENIQDDPTLNIFAEETSEQALIDSEETLRELELHRATPMGPCAILKIITGADQGIQAQILLQEDLYRHTNPNNSRSLLDLPGFYHHYFCPKKNYFWTQLFYNQTSNGFFTKESTQLQSYVLLNNPNLIQRIEEQKFPADVPSILAIFSNMKLQDRRLGFMLGGQHAWNNWHVRAYAPLYYLERNLSLTDEEQAMLERAGLPAVDNDKKMDFARNHLIIDKLGFGDSRIELGYMPYDNDMLMARIGGMVTVPTAIAFKKGLYGTSFSKSTPAPNFSLLNFLNTVITDQDLIAGALQAEEFLVAAVDRLSTMVLETGMGNEGHTGIGVFTDHQLSLSECWTLRSKSSLEYLTPRTEKRFYIMKKTAAEFNRDYDSDDEAVCAANLAFLNEQLIQTLFPTMFETRISPGYIFLWNTSLTYQGEKLDFQFGYDLYWQDKEKLGTINATPAQVAKLRTDIAIKPCAYQSKLFGDLVYKKKGTCRDYQFGFHLDATLLSVGIGRDFTGAFYVNATI